MLFGSRPALAYLIAMPRGPKRVTATQLARYSRRLSSSQRLVRFALPSNAPSPLASRHLAMAAYFPRCLGRLRGARPSS